MIKKLFTRALVVMLIAVLGYFAFISSDVETVPIERSDRAAAALPKETMMGEDVQYKSFDSKGNEIVSGSSKKVTQTGEDNLKLEEGLELKIRIEGKDYRIEADSYGPGDDEAQIMTANPGNTILLSVEDVTIETEGPLIYDKDGVFSTEAVAKFRMGDASGESSGLRYQPDVFLELLKDCNFQSRGEQGNLRITSDYMLMREEDGKGRIQNGILTSVSIDGASQTQLMADEIDLIFDGGREGQPFRLVEASLTGEPTRFDWSQGNLSSSRFDACFDDSGKWLAELITGPDSQFGAETEDGYRLYGSSGQLSLWMNNDEPRELSGRSPIAIEGHKQDGSLLRLAGKNGLETVFSEGRAYSTRIFGEPTFSYDGQEGSAGNLRASHNERNIIFSEGSELWDSEQQVRVKADRILLSDWDQEEKEVNAFDFVQVSYEAEGAASQCFADEMKFKLPGHYMLLKGSPAKVNRQDMTIDAGELEITQIDDEWFNLKAGAVGSGEVALLLITENGPAQIRARGLDYRGEEDRLIFDNVIQAILSEQGELSCQTMEVNLRDRGEKKVVDNLVASGDVIFSGMTPDEEEPKPVNCQAETMTYTEAEGVLYFTGASQPVVLTHPSGSFRGKELTYNLKDGSIRGDSDKHGSTKTTISLKRQLSKNR